jgi:hypothetical protein
MNGRYVKASAGAGVINLSGWRVQVCLNGQCEVASGAGVCIGKEYGVFALLQEIRSQFLSRQPMKPFEPALNRPNLTFPEKSYRAGVRTADVI